MTKFEKTVAELIELLKASGPLADPLNKAISVVTQSLLSGHKLLICGNGGSAADALHLAAEFTCRFKEDRPPYPAIALSDNVSYLTAVGNDYSFEEVFARQVQAFGVPGDVLIAFSTSGRSQNVLKAIIEANKRGLDTISFLGKDGGFIRGHSTVEIIVPSTNTARIQEVHQVLFHVLCEAVEEQLLNH